MDYTAQYACELGRITLASDGSSITGLWFEGQKYYAVSLGEEHEEKGLPVFEQAKRWLDIYFSGREPGFTPPLALRGTPFRKEVWAILLTISYGQTCTYGEIAAKLAQKRHIPRMSSRAVGAAVGHNPVSLIVPCHRVIGADGSLTGYAGGLERKKRLLALEKALPERK